MRPRMRPHDAIARPRSSQSRAGFSCLRLSGFSWSTWSAVSSACRRVCAPKERHISTRLGPSGPSVIGFIRHFTVYGGEICVLRRPRRVLLTVRGGGWPPPPTRKGWTPKSWWHSKSRNGSAPRQCCAFRGHCGRHCPQQCRSPSRQSRFSRPAVLVPHDRQCGPPPPAVPPPTPGSAVQNPRQCGPKPPALLLFASSSALTADHLSAGLQ
jgi:hypothetical protein